MLLFLLTWTAQAGSEVVVLRADVARGVKIRAEDLALASVDEPLAAETAVREVAVGVGRVATEALYAGDILRAERLSAPDAGAGFKPLLPRGFLAFAIPIDPRLLPSLAGETEVDLWLVRAEASPCVLAQALTVIDADRLPSATMVVVRVLESEVAGLQRHPGEDLRIAIRNPAYVERRKLPSCDDGRTPASDPPRAATNAPTEVASLCATPEGTTPVVLANFDQYTGVAIASGDLRTVEVSCASVPVGAFASVDAVVGLMPVRRILGDEMVRVERLFRDDPAMPASQLAPGERWVLAPAVESCPAGTEDRGVVAVQWSEVGAYLAGKGPKKNLRPACTATANP